MFDSHPILRAGSYYEDVWAHVAALPRYAMPLGIPQRDSGGAWHTHFPHPGSIHMAHIFGNSSSKSPDQHGRQASHSEKAQHQHTAHHKNHTGHGGMHVDHSRMSSQATFLDATSKDQTGHSLPAHHGAVSSGPASAATPDHSLHRVNTAPPDTNANQPGIHAPTHLERSGKTSSRPSSWTSSTAIGESKATLHEQSVPASATHGSGYHSSHPKEFLRPLHIHGDHIRHQHNLPSPPPLHGPRNPPVALMPARIPWVHSV